MRTAMIASMLLVGCGFKAGSKHPDARMPIDSTKPGPDADPPPDVPPDAQACFGTGAYQVCLDAAPTNPVTLPMAIDTSLDASNAPKAPCVAAPAGWTAAGQPDACFIIGTTITSPTGAGKTTVTGSRPLVLLASDSMMLNTIDVSSHGAMAGAGAGSTDCGAFGSQPDNDSNGAGGGAGGSFMTIGGSGGKGDNGNADDGTNAPADGSAPTALRGGCAGQPGGNGTQNSGTPGAGGGAIYLVAANTIAISGHITANGAGAMHGGHASGGSGGGSGGMIVVYAQSITGMTVDAELAANGGGGASGGDNNSNGMDGKDSMTATTAAAGGTGPGGAGGAGSVDAGTGGNPGSGGSNQGGGGGGGGAGYIQIHGAMTSLTISPPAATF